MQFSYSAYQIKQALWQICVILILAVIFGLVSNTVRKQHLPLIGDWSTEGRLTTDTGDTFAIPFSEAVTAFDQKTAVFIDARGDDLFKQGHIKGAKNLPWHDVDDYFMALAKDLKPTDRIITYCDGETCNLSHDLALFLIDLGFLNTKVLVNGWTLWIDNNLPVEKEE
jgi:rhodanese-related sulfurtransferase